MIVNSDQDFHALIQLIYSVDYQSDETDQMLDRLSHAIGADMVGFGMHDAASGVAWSYASKALRDAFDTNTPKIAEMMGTYKDLYVHGPRYLRDLGPEHFHLVRDVFVGTQYEQQSEDWHRETARLNLGGQHLGAVFNQEGRRQGFLSAGFHDDAKSSQIEHAISQSFWLQHLLASKRMQEKLGEQDQAVATLTTLFDQLYWGIIVVNGKNQVIFTNDSADQVMDEWPQIRVRHGDLNVPSALYKGYGGYWCGRYQRQRLVLVFVIGPLAGQYIGLKIWYGRRGLINVKRLPPRTYRKTEMSPVGDDFIELKML